MGGYIARSSRRAKRWLRAPAGGRNGVSEAMAEREIIFEIRRIGMVAKATAVDVASGIEASITGPANAAEVSLREAARRKLEYVLRRRQKSGGG